MPLNIEDKKSIIKYRVENNALLVDKGMFAKTHAGVIVKINEHFVKTGILSRDEGRTISIPSNPQPPS